MTLETAKYLALFVAEAGDRLSKLGSDLVKLEGAARQKEDTAPIVDSLFRHAHSVKGMAASMQLGGIATLAHRAEDLVDLFRRRAAAPDPESVDALLAAVDALSALVARAERGENPDPEPALVGRLRAAAERVRGGGESGAGAPAIAPGAPGPEVPRADPPAREGRRRLAIAVEVAPSCPVPAVRAFLVVKKLAPFGPLARSSPPVQDLKLGQLPGRTLEVTVETAAPIAEVERALSQISDLARVAVEVEGVPAEDKPPPAPPGPNAEAPEGGRTVRVRVELLDSFLDAVGELILATARLREVGRAVPEPYRPPLEEGVDRLHATVKDLHDKVMAVRMTPLALVTEQLPRAARDVARRTGKQVEVEVRGAEIEIDRAILDEVSDGLLHVLRNAVDHGLEAPHLRLLAGKKATGRITVTARRERDRVLLEIADDGKGMDPDRLRFSAVAMGALTEAAAAALTDREALLLACLPGVSTAQEVTELSGRGVGMDAVKRTVEALGGALEVESQRGYGTRWTLRLPLTVAVQPVLLVDVASEVLGLPIAKVHGAAQVEVERLDHSEGKPVLPYHGRLVPVKDLGHLLGFAPRRERAARSIVLAEGDGTLVGLAVDALLGQHEAVLKPLVRPLDLVPGLSAVTVLGNGRPVFILDVQRLVVA
ncbi:MAG TPA: chemotaxis protein CheA [Anaeromyxobacteraceae bacterium]|nr:chemotaxis protein CheA [Anaeromyxobacteraceae bacterium]